MKKITTFIIQTVAYFSIVLLIFYIAQKIGIMADRSILAFAIGSTIGWVIIEGVLILTKKNSRRI